MERIGEIDSYDVFLLDDETTKKYVTEILELVQQIPEVSFTPEEILAHFKGDRIYYGKEKYSLIVFDKEVPIAVLISYERASENNEQYPENTVYLSMLAVAKQYQRKGIASKLLTLFFDHTKRESLLFLEGKLNYTIQTNSAPWNEYVKNLYRKFGFTLRTTKQYENRVDLVLELHPR